MALQSSRKKVVAVKYGANVAGTDTVNNTENVQLQPKMQTGTYKNMDGGQGSKSTWRNDDFISVDGLTVKSYVEANDLAGTALDTIPSWSDIFKTCALKETVDTTTVSEEFVAYTPLDTAVSALSQMAIWTDGNKDLVTGIVGNYKLSGKVGEPLMHEASFSGFTDLVPTADANPSGSSVDPKSLIVMKSTDTVKINAVGYKAHSFEFDQGNQLENFYGTSIKTFDKVDFDSTLTVTFYKENNVVSQAFKDGDTLPVEITVGGVNGKSVQISSLQAEIEEVTRGTEKEKETITVKFSLQPTTGTAYDQYMIKYGFIA